MRCREISFLKEKKRQASHQLNNYSLWQCGDLLGRADQRPDPRPVPHGAAAAAQRHLRPAVHRPHLLLRPVERTHRHLGVRPLPGEDRRTQCQCSVRVVTRTGMMRILFQVAIGIRRKTPQIIERGQPLVARFTENLTPGRGFLFNCENQLMVCSSNNNQCLCLQAARTRWW